MLYETFFSISISKNVFYFNQKHFTTNFHDEKCFSVQPSSKHVEGTLLGPFNQRCAPSPTSDESFKMADDLEDCSGHAVNQLRPLQQTAILQ